jgi:hypothetical protein
LNQLVPDDVVIIRWFIKWLPLWESLIQGLFKGYERVILGLSMPQVLLWSLFGMGMGYGRHDATGRREQGGLEGSDPPAYH